MRWHYLYFIKAEGSFLRLCSPNTYIISLSLRFPHLQKKQTTFACLSLLYRWISCVWRLPVVYWCQDPAARTLHPLSTHSNHQFCREWPLQKQTCFWWQPKLSPLGLSLDAVFWPHVPLSLVLWPLKYRSHSLYKLVSWIPGAHQTLNAMSVNRSKKRKKSMVKKGKEKKVRWNWNIH